MASLHPQETNRDRPAISVVVPFRGDRVAAARTLASLRSLKLREGDEVILADNTSDRVMRATARSGLRIVHAARERSAYHARNAGARAARGEWILFLDADCVPRPDLLDAFLAEPVRGNCGALAGQILGDPDQPSFTARYARSRNLFDHADGLIRAADGGAAAGNLLVRRAAFERIGGFAEGIRSGGDLDLCRRLQDGGWRLDFRPAALVHHRHRETLPSLLGALARYGSGASWLNERYPGSSPPWPIRAGLTSVARDMAGHVRGGRFEDAVFRGVDGLGLLAHRVGYASSNDAGSLD
jgi:GT2 family glycosyltransferase